MAKHETTAYGYPGTYVRFLSVYNDSGVTAPPGAAMRITRIDGNGIAHIDKPDTNGQIDGIVFNDRISLPAASYGSATQETPAVVAYTENDAESSGDIPRNGEIWGTVAGSWFLSRAGCGNGWFVLGGAGEGLVNVTVADNKPRKFRITSRTETICGNSGSTTNSGTELSGSNATDHTIYIYELHSVHAVDDGDGCPRFVDDDIDVAIVVDEAYEQNSNSVAIGTVVDAEMLTYNDESLSGSEAGSGSATAGPAGCRWVFSHGGSSSASSQAPDRYRYFCVSGILKEYTEDRNGELTFLRNNGCCDCTDFGSGSGAPGDCDICDPYEDALCITMSHLSCNETLFPSCKWPDYITVMYTGSNLGINQIWEGTNTNIDGEEFTAKLILTCGSSLYLNIHAAALDCDLTGYAALLQNCDLDQVAVPMSHNYSVCYDGSLGEIALATITVGDCPGDILDSGSSTDPDCPCYWHFIEASWIQVNSYPGCINPVDIPAEDTYRYTTLDGTEECEPDLSTVPTCSECDTSANRTATGGGGGFLSGISFPLTLTPLSQAGTTIWSSESLAICSQNGYLLYWCEGGRWFATIKGSGVAFEAQNGATCASMTFNMSFDTSNTLCPGQSGTLTVTITT